MSAPLSPERKAELRRLLALAPPVPWEYAFNVESGVTPTDYGDEPWAQANWALLPDVAGADPNHDYVLAGIDDRDTNECLVALRLAQAAVNALPELLDEIERLQGALADAAAWVVRDVGIPVDMTTSEPPPDVLREAMYRYYFEDPNGTIHGGDLTYDEMVAFVDEEARWAPVDGGEA